MLILGYCPKCGYVFSGDEEVDVNNFNDYGVLRECYGTPFCYYYLCVLQSFLRLSPTAARTDLLRTTNRLFVDNLRDCSLIPGVEHTMLIRRPTDHCAL